MAVQRSHSKFDQHRIYKPHLTTRTSCLQQEKRNSSQLTGRQKDTINKIEWWNTPPPPPSVQLAKNGGRDADFLWMQPCQARPTSSWHRALPRRCHKESYSVKINVISRALLPNGLRRAASPDHFHPGAAPPLQPEGHGRMPMPHLTKPHRNESPSQILCSRFLRGEKEQQWIFLFTIHSEKADTIISPPPCS